MGTGSDGNREHLSDIPYVLSSAEAIDFVITELEGCW
jgi:hypothetical protein